MQLGDKNLSFSINIIDDDIETQKTLEDLPREFKNNLCKLQTNYMYLKNTLTKNQTKE